MQVKHTVDIAYSIQWSVWV